MGMALILYPIRLDKVIKPGDDLIEYILEKLNESDISIDNGDILALSIKAVSTSLNLIININSITPSNKALEYSRRYNIDPRIAELVIRESDYIIGGVNGLLSTIKNGILIGNAGVDRKNAGLNKVVVWPKHPDRVACEIRDRIFRETNKKIGVILVDSRVTPLRRGTIGVAIGISGFKPIKDYRGVKDIFGYTIRFTWHNIADDLASAAHLLMGESNELIPAVYIKGAPVELCDECDSKLLKVDTDECIFLRNILRT